MTLIQTYENKLKILHDQKVMLREKIENYGRILPDFDETFRTAFTFVSNPCDLWSSTRLEDKRAVLKLVFAEKLSYHPTHGFRTTKSTLPFNKLERLGGA
jgi:site-specific DNA recombinase